MCIMYRLKYLNRHIHIIYNAYFNPTNNNSVQNKYEGNVIVIDKKER